MLGGSKTSIYLCEADFQCPAPPDRLLTERRKYSPVEIVVLTPALDTLHQTKDRKQTTPEQ